MALDPIDHIPETLRVGDTWFFELQYGDYPAGTWDLKVYFGSLVDTFSATATANGNAHRFTVAATTTADYVPGGYSYQIRAEHSTDGRVFTVGEGYVDLLAPMSEQADHRDRVKKVLDAIDAVLENRATNDHLAVSIAGRSISKMSISELREFRGWYSSQWERIKGRNRQKAFGKSRGNNIRARFT